jgi:hypothetical protein
VDHHHLMVVLVGIFSYLLPQMVVVSQVVVVQQPGQLLPLVVADVAVAG